MMVVPAVAVTDQTAIVAVVAITGVPDAPPPFALAPRSARRLQGPLAQPPDKAEQHQCGDDAGSDPFAAVPQPDQGRRRQETKRVGVVATTSGAGSGRTAPVVIAPAEIRAAADAAAPLGLRHLD